MSPGKKKKPASLGEILAGVLEQSGVSARIEQAGIIPEWPAIVGSQIAAVTTPLSIAADGTLFVAVTTNAWMMELSMLEPELLRAVNRKEGRAPVKKIRWLLQRG